jgi:hypothetical protein
VIPEVVEQVLDGDGEKRRDLALSLELTEPGIVTLDELLHDVALEIRGMLRPEAGPPAGMGDDRLDEVQVPEEELLGGEVARGGGEGGHGLDTREFLLGSANSGDSIGVEETRAQNEQSCEFWIAL